MHNSDWNVQQLRFTGFIPPNVDYDINPWWGKITGEEPENILSKPKEQILEANGKYKSGENEGYLKLISKPNRVDLLYESYLDRTSFDFPSLGSFQDLAKHFSENLISKLIYETGDFPEITRLAFGCIIYQLTEDNQGAFKLLSDYIKCIDFKLVHQNIDFLYSTNRPRTIKIDNENIEINRLMKWHTKLAEVVEMNVNTGEKIHKTYPAMFLELDINTAVTRGKDVIYNNDDVINIFNELTNLASEITINGDIE